MNVISCPKCHHVRPPDARCPEWQCPACGVVYAKAADARSRSGQDGSLRAARHAAFKPERNIPWARLAGIAALCWGAYLGLTVAERRAEDQAGGGRWSNLMSSWPESGQGGSLRTLAAATKPGDVVIYSTSWCPTCSAAKQWMRQEGFAYTECDVERDASCTARWQSLGGNGVPYVVVRGKVLNAGFDSREFVAALKRGG